MASSTRLSDVIVKMPDRSTCRIERRLVAKNTGSGAPERSYICSLPSGEPVQWLGSGKYRLPCGAVAVAVAHKQPSNGKEDNSGPS